MLMQIFKLETKEKIRRFYPVVILVGVCGYFYVKYFVRYAMFHSADLETIMQTQKLAFLVFLALAFLAFDFFSDLNKQSWKELSETTSLGTKSVFISRILLLLCIVGIFFINIVVIDFLLVWPCSWMPVGIRGNVWVTLILNFIFFPVVGMFLGIFAGACLRRWQGYLLLVVCMLLFIGVFQTINTNLFLAYEGKIQLDIVSRIFTLTQPNQQWVIDELYLIPVEPYRFFLYVGWILLFLGGILFWGSKKKKNLVLYIVSWGACALCLVQVVDAGCISNLDSNTGNVASDFNTFLNEEAETVEPNFSVSSYEIVLSARKELKAEVCMKLDCQQEQYQFTLYRGYKLLSVSDQDGISLEYDREDDYITVYAPQGASEITMTYRGYSGTFVSNSNAILLPGFFAWYPQPGFRPVFIRSLVDTIDSYGYNKDLSTLQESEFKIELPGYLKTVYSNLDGSDQLFEGKSKTVTLMGGAVEEVIQDNVRVIYPSLMEIPENYVQQYQDALEYDIDYLKLETRVINKIDTIFLLPGTYIMADSDGKGFSMEDHLVTAYAYDPINAAAGQIYNIMPQEGLKDVLWQAVLERMEGNERGYSISREQYLNWEPESDVPDWPVENMYATLIKNFDGEAVDQKIMDYLKDTDTEQDCITFLKELYLELEGEIS